ncbi:hypothetical protein NLX86_15260 [Streptomyces sp. A3M-1-3]|uniref:hypothetical protein n=1 Tax=Streptomyces sp. A3M-1-3 TaxID=2962044 RepID=UPI0020B64F93|nr:hypothetical protein [Streptomyces sp. A3M-1-3]MCP3819415.1 hypothetical protein [Streptomyces sp. A3M-1-3]
MIHRFILSILGNPKLITFALRCWAVITDGLVHPAIRIAGGVAATGAGMCAITYFIRFRATLEETRHAVETSDDLTGDPGNVMDILQLLSLVWLISGIALIALGLLVAVARSGSVLIIVGGCVWWAPLGFLGLRLPAASGLHLIAGIFVALVIPAAVLCPAERFADIRRRRAEPAGDAG